MASSLMSLKLACVVVLCLAVLGAPLAQGAINCGEVTSKLAPCIPYLKGPGGGAVPPACCSGIKTLNGEAQTAPDRQAACNCLKSAAATITGINLNLASGLPGKCGVSIPYQISPSTDCKSVK
ncbi:non-specific lipid-transfer protein-like isoform X2 [Hibiscus syriacus]|uniref:non-specific lipid-transfer protein-like isoform X1 n=1 Tax=Hibiscus syriacus TaxID=106335 RepID=UPI001924EBBA|nr:non-specific lipid-transfer protein-like isoform X1 [Hibiscus syriacus]XP_039045838.1 non-specific lipid-transfer protein-like isoform X2 [Hibiscus syriacus]